MNQIININKEYISLRDIVKNHKTKDPDKVIENWINDISTIKFLASWEIINNTYFKVSAFYDIKNKLADNTFTLTTRKWIKSVNSIGLNNKIGKIGETYVHRDIAIEFSSWLSAEFKLYLIKDFQRLRKEESDIKDLNFNIKKSLLNINYTKENIVIPNRLSQKDTYTVYTNDADIVNMSVFGKTAKDWKAGNQNMVGSIRDNATIYQLICLSNLEYLNSEFIKMHMNQKERLFKLNDAAINQMKFFIQSKAINFKL